MTIELIELLRRKPWRDGAHRRVFSEFAGVLRRLVAPMPERVRPPRIHTLP